MTLADYLREKAVTDQAFATLIGVDRSNVYRMRNAGQIPSPDVIRRIAEVTRGTVTPNDFFGIACPASTASVEAA